MEMLLLGGMTAEVVTGLSEPERPTCSETKQIRCVAAFRRAEQMRNTAVKNETSRFHREYFTGWLKWRCLGSSS